MAIEYYPTSVVPLTTTDIWSVNQNSTRNIDLRAKLHQLLFGDRAHPGQGKTVLLRSMQSVCPCIMEERGQKMREPDPKCSICQGEGYTFIDKPYTVWRSVLDSHSGGALAGSFAEQLPGLTALVGYNFIFEYDVPIKDIDKIIEFGLDREGNVPPQGLPNPVKEMGEPNRLALQYKKFKIAQFIIYRGDRGRVEFLRCVCEKEEF